MLKAISMQLEGEGWGCLKKREELNFAAKTKEVTFDTSAKTKWILYIDHDCGEFTNVH